ncbi:UPF0187-domain-containing protein [Pholiota conissans]|uniref:UPF0187-domain-containing protein n=1 Tax=Pholiota conissans TaxID=109636 RepID=A0A9P5Z4Q2_9AGAR|nr:UPF0187-domain-containing protein [Pholiota conissans]
MPHNTLKNKRSMTGKHTLLPASRPMIQTIVPGIPTYSLLAWTLGRGSVIWRIWPAVLLHTTFAVVIVTLSMRGIANLVIPSVMLTVLGVVIGFVISYRAVSGYDRYWMGRTCWSDVIRNSRTLSRLIWFHVPPRLTPKTPEEIASGQVQRSEEELNRVMAEKLMALDLIEGFCVALKHHIRGELGIYYEDLYHRIRPMHEHDHAIFDNKHAQDIITSSLPSPRRAQQITKETTVSPAPPKVPSHILVDVEPTEIQPTVIPPINAYGTFDPAKLASTSRSPSSSSSGLQPMLRKTSSTSDLSVNSTQSQHQPLLPSTQPPPQDNVLDKVSGDLIPFAGVISSLRRRLGKAQKKTRAAGQPQETEQGTEPTVTGRQWQGPVYSGMHAKHRPKVAGGGENLPLEIIRCLSEWASNLEDRGTVPGSSMGPMIGTIAAFEDSLTSLERILTTPLPFVYAVHIRHTVWVYLFFLPFQLVNQFGYYTIPGVAIAAFIYLGFLAAGEEIEQPFGYDDNDLDLDLFCHDIIHADIKQLKASPCLNVYFGPGVKHVDGERPLPRRSLTVTEAVNLPPLNAPAKPALPAEAWL